METGPSTADSKETNISTFVFLDFESTSLLDKKCRITELCMLAVNRVDMEEEGGFPRVTNKLTLCLNPKTPISMTASNITGLYNDSLEHQKALTEETIELVKAFLNHLTQPVCLLAHNGNRFDFPLLVSELQRVNQSLDSFLLCADTLEAFRSLDGLPAKYEPFANQNSGKNTPIRTDVTPLKPATSREPSSLKRKGTNDIDTLSNHSPSVSGQEKEKPVEKVKKKLKFEDDESKERKTSEGPYAANSMEKAVEKEEEVEEFSASLADEDYILALEDIEKDLCKETLVFPKHQKEKVHESIANNMKKAENAEEDASELLDKKTAVAAAYEPCCVANGTGYLVRQSTQESHTTEADDYLLKSQETNNHSDAFAEKTDAQKCPSSAVTIQTENNGKDPGSSDVETTQMSFQESTETNFVVTMRPKQDSPVSGGVCNYFKSSSVSSSKSSETNTECTEWCNENETSNVRCSEESVIPVPSAAALGYSPIGKTEPLNLSNQNLTSALNPGSKSGSASVSTANSLYSMHSPASNISPAQLSETALPNSTQLDSTLSSGTEVSSKSCLNSVSMQNYLISQVPESTAITSKASNASPALSNITAPANFQTGSSNFKRQSYKLEEIYLRKFGRRPLQSHKAEDDCVTMLNIAKVSEGFIEWVDKNAVLFSTIAVPF